MTPERPWSQHVEGMISRASKAGYLLEYRGEPDFGWNFKRDGKMILANVDTTTVEIEMQKLGI